MAGIAAEAAGVARSAADRAIANADAAAAAARDAADHAGEAAGAAERSTAAANAATAAAEESAAAARAAQEIYDEARAAEDARLLAAFEQGRQTAQAAAAEADRRKAQARWDAEQTRRRSAETEGLLASAANPDTPPAEAVTAGRKAALALADAPGAWTQEAAALALGGSDAVVMDFVRVGLPRATGLDDRATLNTLAVTGSDALAAAANVALAGTDAQVGQFLRTQDYPRRATEDRLTVNRLQAAAREAGQTVVVERAQRALDAADPAALRAFIATGHAEAVTVDDRIKVNQVMADPESGREVRQEAQIALDGPDGALHQFLVAGRFAAAQRDQDREAHEAAVTALLLQSQRAAAAADQNAKLAQEAAAIARDAAEEAAGFARAAQEAADRAAGFARQADASADRAQVSAERAAASARTARTAARSAAGSANRATRSATAAQGSFRQAVGHAQAAATSYKRAYDAAIAAGHDANAAIAAGNAAIDHRDNRIQQDRAKSLLVQGEACADRYFYDEAAYRACIKRIEAIQRDPAAEAYKRASVICDFLYPTGTEANRACALDAFSPFFEENQAIDIVLPWIHVMTVLFTFAAVGDLLALGFLLGPELVAVCRTYCLAALNALVDPALAGETITMSAYLNGIGGFTMLTGVVGVRFAVFLQEIGVKVKAVWALFARTPSVADELQRLGRLGPASVPDELAFLTRDYRRFGNLSREEFVRRYWDPTVRNADGSFGNWNWSKGRPDGELPLNPSPYRPRAGEMWDGFDGPNGTLLHPYGTPFSQRSLPPSSLDGYVKYRWPRDWDEAAGAVQAGRTPPGFEQPGGGTQFRLDRSLEELERLGYVQRLPGSLDDWERDFSAVVAKYQLDDEVAGMLREGRADAGTLDRLLGRGLDPQAVALTASDHGASGLNLLDALSGATIPQANALNILQDAASLGRMADVEALARAGVLTRLLGRGFAADDLVPLVDELGAGSMRAIDALVQGGVTNPRAVQTMRQARLFSGTDDVERLATGGNFENLSSLPSRVDEAAVEALANRNAIGFAQHQYGHQYALRSAAERARTGRVALESANIPSINNGSLPSRADVIDHGARQAVQMKAVTAGSPPRPENPDRVVENILDGAAQLRGERSEWPPVGYRRVIDVYVLNPQNDFYGIANRAELLAALKAKGLTAEALRGVDELWINNGTGKFTFLPANFL